MAARKGTAFLVEITLRIPAFRRKLVITQVGPAESDWQVSMQNHTSLGFSAYTLSSAIEVAMQRAPFLKPITFDMASVHEAKASPGDVIIDVPGSSVPVVEMPHTDHDQAGSDNGAAGRKRGKKAADTAPVM